MNPLIIIGLACVAFGIGNEFVTNKKKVEKKVEKKPEKKLEKKVEKKVEKEVDKGE